MQREMRQHLLAAVRIGERYVVKIDFAAHLLPVFLLRLEAVAVFRLDLRTVLNGRLSVNQSDDALYIRL